MTEITARVIILYGDDEHAVSKRLKAYQAALGDSTTADMNITRLDGRSLTDEELNNAVNSLPFLGDKRLVLLANPSDRYQNKKGQELFTQLLEKVPETTRIVIHGNMENPDKEKKKKEESWLLKWAGKAGGLVSVERHVMPRAWEMTGWILAETKKQGGSIEPRGAAMLAEMVGENTSQAAQEITKLLTYVNYERPITVADVEQVSLDTAQGNIFVLVDALGSSQGKKAQAMLHRLLDEQDPKNIFGMIVRQFRFLLLAREVIDGGGNINDIQSALSKFGMPVFTAKNVYFQAKQFSQEALEAIYHRLLAIDEEAKTSDVPLDLAMDMLVVELTK
ncbi:MAG: DNA polymerase III subunit delta [Anaerolineales bacterium]|nr:DNA polymerase III subunit delta [Anaerolineales bacterium]